MPTEQEFLNELFGIPPMRKLGEPLKTIKQPSVDQYSVDLGEEPPAETGEDEGIDFVGDAEKFKNISGLSFSSAFRTPEHNAEVGGVPTSQHLSGTAVDIPTENLDAPALEKVKSYWQGLGSYDVIDEGDHIHVEPMKGVKSKTSYGADGSFEQQPKEKSPQELFLSELFAPPKGDEEVEQKLVPDKSFMDTALGSMLDLNSRVLGAIMDKVRQKDIPSQAYTEEELSVLVEEDYAKYLKNQASLPEWMQDSSQTNLKMRSYFEEQRLREGTGPMANDIVLNKIKAQELKEQEREATRLAMAEAKSKNDGFWGTLANYIDNPVYGVINNSLVANLAKGYSRESAHNRMDYEKLREIVKARQINEKPENYSPEIASWAAAVVKRQEAKLAEGDPTISQMWGNFTKAATESPATLLASFANAFAADPEMVFIPGGVGAKPFQAALKVGKLGKTAAKATKLADSIIDVGTAGGLSNIAFEGAAQYAEGEELSASEAANSALTGFLFGGTFAAIGGARGLFKRGAIAQKDLAGGAGKLSETDLETAMRKTAKEELAIETLIEFPHVLSRDVREALSEALGIKDMSKKERKAWHKKRYAELVQTFKDEKIYADWFQLFGEERAQFQELLQKRAEAESLAKTQAKVKQQEVDRAFEESQREKTTRFHEDYEKALAARDQEVLGNTQDAARAEDILRNATKRLDEQDIIEAAIDAGVPQVRRAMEKAAKRDAKLRVPKWQKGEVDRTLVARLGVGALFAGTAAAAADEDHKLAAAFFGGLAGLVVPGGGTVARQLAQSGATTVDGDIISLALKGAKNADADQMAWDAAKIHLAKQKDQKAFADLFNKHAPKVQRYVRRKIQKVASRLGIASEDVVQEVFESAFMGLDKYKGDVPFSAYLMGIARNKSLEAIRSAYTLKGGKGTFTDSMYAAAPEFGGNATQGHIAEGDAPLVDPKIEAKFSDELDTPENQAVRQQAHEAINSILDKLPQRERDLFVLNKLEYYSLQESADKVSVSYTNAGAIISRTQEAILKKLKETFEATGDILKGGEVITKRGRWRQQSLDSILNKEPKLSSNDVQLYHATTAMFYEHIKKEGIRGFSPIEINKTVAKDLGIKLTDALLDYLDENYWMGEARSNVRRGPFFTSQLSRAQEIAGIGDDPFSSLAEGPAGIARDIGFYLQSLGDKKGAAKAFAYEDTLRKSPARIISLKLPKDAITGVYGSIPTDINKFKGDIVLINKKGRVLPKKQIGEANPELLKMAAVAAGFGIPVAYFVQNTNQNADGTYKHYGDRGYRDPLLAGLATAGGVAILFGSRGKAAGFEKNRGLGDDVLNKVVPLSTEVYYASKPIFKEMQQYELNALRDTHTHLEEVKPFLMRMKELIPETQDILKRAMLTGNSSVIQNILGALNDKTLTETYAQARKTIDSLGDELVKLNRFQKGNIDYWTRIVKDKAGLFEAIKKTPQAVGLVDQIKVALKKAEVASLKKSGRPLNVAEESAIINRVLLNDPKAIQPSWTKARGIKEIPKEWVGFYANLDESIHTYIRAAVQDIQKAKLFGKYAENMKKGKFEYLDNERSITNIVNGLLQKGELTEHTARVVSDALKARFGKGEMAEPEWISNMKNVANIGFLGNLWTAASQLSDIPLQLKIQGIHPTLEAIAREFSGKQFIRAKEFGLADNLVEEWANQNKISKFTNKYLRYTFGFADIKIKELALNAAIIKAKSLAQSDSGIVKLAHKYEDMFGDSFKQLVSDLKQGNVTSDTRLVAWMEATKTQPLSRLEMPRGYLNNPKLRAAWSMKSYQIKQLDVLHRTARDDIRKGNIAKGLGSLASTMFIMGAAGASWQFIRDWSLGKDAHLDWGDIPMNMLRNLGFSQYTMDRALGVSAQEAAERREAGDENAGSRKPDFLGFVADQVTPAPYTFWRDMVSGRPEAYSRYLVPVVGPYVAEMVKNADEEAAEQESQLKLSKE